MTAHRTFRTGPAGNGDDPSFEAHYFQIKERIVLPDGKEDWVIRPLNAAETEEARRRLEAAMWAKHGNARQKSRQLNQTGGEDEQE